MLNLSTYELTLKIQYKITSYKFFLLPIAGLSTRKSMWATKFGPGPHINTIFLMTIKGGSRVGVGEVIIPSLQKK